MADIGYWAIALALVVSAYSAVAAFLGARRGQVALLQSARNGAILAAVACSAALLSLLSLLLSRDFSVQYVYEHVSTHLPTAYTVSAVWAGQEGSLLLWLWVLSLLTVVLAGRGSAWAEAAGPYALAAMAFTQSFLGLVLLFSSNPFQAMPMVPVEGQGLNPLLQNFWMVVHPPVVFVGYALYTVPFALALGGLMVGKLDRDWLQAVRRWALLAWLFLGAGIAMGAWWAYLELGWGGYWGWDPVENSSLIPWLTGTALLHSLMMQQRRGAFKTWNLWLVALTFVLCVFATFVTRSGVIQSVHAFERSSVGYYFMAFIVLCLLAMAALMLRRQAEREERPEFTALLSREAGLLLTNLLFMGAAAIVLVGTLFPTLTEALRGQQVALGGEFYERSVGPLLQITVLCMGICPWLAWGGGAPSRLRWLFLPPAVVALAVVALLWAVGLREALALLSFAIGAFVAASLVSVVIRDVAARGRAPGAGWTRIVRLLVANRRRYGAHLVHLAIVLIALGVTGSSVYQSEAQLALAPGESTSVGGYTLKYISSSSERAPDSQRYTAIVEAYRGATRIATLKPQRDYYLNTQQWVTEVSIRSTLKEDLYLILAGLEKDGLATFRVLVNPLVIWLWIGGALLLVGGALAWWPSAPKETPA